MFPNQGILSKRIPLHLGDSSTISVCVLGGTLWYVPPVLKKSEELLFGKEGHINRRKNSSVEVASSL